MRTALAVLGALALTPGIARAGGFELPDNGTQALGRGAAFSAKADDGTALEYNVAGLAQQRGTRLLFDGHLLLSSYSFQRAGIYPDDRTNPRTPWGGTFFPAVSNQGGPFFAPLAALSSDLGLDGWTFAAGAFGPSAAGNRTYPLGVAGEPSPARYDVVQDSGLIVYPTAAVAARVLPWLDLGLAAHAVYGRFDVTSASFTDLGASFCPNPEFQPCDARTHLQTQGTSFTASGGALLRPERWLALGVNFRGPVTLDTTGTVDAVPPTIAPLPIAPASASFKMKLPWVLRGGVRFIAHEGNFELGDVELDATYEGWGAAQGDGPEVTIPALGLFKNIRTIVAHGYHDTFSVRLGGAYNFAFDGSVLTLRGGTYYDSSATDAAMTRLDFDTLDKIAGTLGLGWRVGMLSLDAAYAEVFDLSRTVTGGALRPINGAANGQSVSATGTPLPVVNNGDYSGHTRILSFAVGLKWDPE